MVPWVHIKTHADAPLDIDRKLIIAPGNETPQSLTFVPLRPFQLLNGGVLFVSPLEMMPWVHIKTHADAPLDIDRKLIIAPGN